MIASVSCSIVGSGTLSTRTSWVPCQVTAFMARGHTPSVPFDIFPGVRRLGPGLLVLVAWPLAGCGTSDDRDQARAVVERFYDAIRDDRADDACAELSAATIAQIESQTEQSCDGVITRLEY